MPVVSKELVCCRLACRHLAHEAFRYLLCIMVASAPRYFVARRIHTSFGLDFQSRFDVGGHRCQTCLHGVLVESKLKVQDQRSRFVPFDDEHRTCVKLLSQPPRQPLSSPKACETLTCMGAKPQPRHPVRRISPSVYSTCLFRRLFGSRSIAGYSSCPNQSLPMPGNH